MHTRAPRWSGILILAVLLLLAACGLPATVTVPAPIAHPTGAQDIVLQLGGVGGGMVPSRIYDLADRFPRFTLFGDGRVVYRSDTGFYQTHLDEAAISRLLTLAVREVRFFQLG